MSHRGTKQKREDEARARGRRDRRAEQQRGTTGSVRDGVGPRGSTESGQGGLAVPTGARVDPAEKPSAEYIVRICDECCDGKGSECHTPDCAFWLRRVPQPMVEAFRPPLEPQARKALAYLLRRIAGWTHARWDQHLRYEYGDTAANAAILTLQHIAGEDTGVPMDEPPFKDTNS